MANLIIKPSAGGQLILKDEGDSAAITVATTGTTTFAENLTMSGTANNLGTVTAGTIGSAVGFPAEVNKGNVLVTAQRVSANKDIADGVVTKVPFEEIYDSHGFWDETNERFLPTIAGYYFISSRIRFSRDTVNLSELQIQHHKTGTAYSTMQWQLEGSYLENSTTNGPTDVILLNGSSDYLEVHIRSSGSSLNTGDQVAPYQNALNIFLVRAT